MNLRKGVPLFCVMSIPALALAGQLSTSLHSGVIPLTQSETSIMKATGHTLAQHSGNAASLDPPSIQYLNAVRKSIGGTSYTDLQLRYVKPLKPTLSMCLFTYEKDRSLLFNEALLSEHDGKWGVAATARPAPVHDSLPYADMDMNGSYGGKIVGNQEVGSIPYQIIGGFINDPAISSVELVDLAGTPIRKLTIVTWGPLKMYAYAQISPTQRIQGWQIRAYDEFGSEIVASNAQLQGQ